MAVEDELQAVLRTLGPEQLRFVARRMHDVSDASAARAVGLSLDTVYGWTNKAAVNEAVRLAQLDGVNVARERLRRLATDAVDALAEELANRRNPRRLDAAKDVLDRVGLGAVHKIAPTDPSGTRKYESLDDLSDADLLAIIAAGRGDGTAGQED